MRKYGAFSIIMMLFFHFYSCQKPTHVKEIVLDELTIADIHKAYEEGAYNCQDLVKAYLRAIDSTNGKINAISYINPNAIDEAKSLDAEYQKTKKLRPLHGIPIVVKDNINTIGMPTTAGALALQDFIPKENAFIINKLKESGAIVLAKSNMAEWAFSPMHTESSTFGTTHNPYRLDRVPAGSSGGTAAAVAANLVLGGLGTDTGNSIRGPSAHTALVGFRTTMGLISREGIVPLVLRNDIVGPMCRTVEDATRMLEVMVGIDTKDPITQYSKDKYLDNYQQFLREDGLKNARIGVLRAISEDEVHADIKNLFEHALTDMDSLGATILDSVVIPNFDELKKDPWCFTFRADLEAFMKEYIQRDTLKTLQDIIRVGSRSSYAEGLLQEFVADQDAKTSSQCPNAYKDVKMIAFREAIETVMDSLKLDALVYPTWNHPPAHIDKFREEYKGDNSQIIAPHTGQPAFTVPMGFTDNNLPAGLQFLGRMYDEATLIKIAFAYERGTNHRKPPVLIEK